MKTMSNRVYRLLALSLIGFIVSVLAGCSSSKKLKYFQDMPEVRTGTEFQMTKFEEVKIQPDDILNIKVNTVDIEVSEAINSGNTPMPGNYMGINVNSVNNQMVTGYLVDHDGTVELPILGKIEVGGLTLLQAKNKIREVSNQYYKDATVSVRFSNFRLVVIGEVNRPGTYVIPNQQVSILDAIGFSGDLTVYGKRDNVMLIRKDDNGKAVAVKLDLTSKALFNSPYFYLRQNDVVYVEPAKAKLLNADTSLIRYLSLLASLASVGILIFR